MPKHLLRNGRLNQRAYSLFLFIRDIADGDLVGWIDRQLAETDDRTDPDRITRMIERLVGPLRQVYGVSDNAHAFRPGRMRTPRNNSAYSLALIHSAAISLAPPAVIPKSDQAF